MFETMYLNRRDTGAGSQPIPPGLDAMEPGVALAGFLASIDVAQLSGYDRVVVLRAHQRMASHYQAQVYADMASVVDAMAEFDTDPGHVGQSAAAEIGAALCLTRRGADVEVDLALELQERLPAVWGLLAGGAIDVRRARTIALGTSHLSVETAQTVVDRVIEEAPRLTTGQLAARLRRVCVEADPDEAVQRYEEAVAGRRFVCEATPAGTANLLGLDLAPDQAASVSRMINRIARSLKVAGEARTMDHLRADVYLDLLQGKATTGNGAGPAGRGVVHVHVDVETLAGLSEAPGELAGFGPVIADIARQVVARQGDSDWRFTVSDPHRGMAVHTGVTRRRPTTSQRHMVETRDRCCVFPGCRMPAVDCDLDHRIAWADGGPTTVCNLTPLCRHHHVVKHRYRWRHGPLPGGDHRWTSPLGHTYTTSGKPP